MWHASISSRLIVPQRELWRVAEHELRGVGDAALGEWRETGDVAVHLRRRLTEKEMRQARIEGVLDVRGTPEHTRRVDLMRPHLPAYAKEFPVEQFS